MVETLLGLVAPKVRLTLERFPNLHSWLKDELEAAPTEWPAISYPVSSFVPFLAEWLSNHFPEGGRLEDLSLSELYLVSACLADAPNAFTTFDRVHWADSRPVLAQMGLLGPQIDEVRQMVMERLFVAAESGKPRIFAYAGHGQIGGLVRVTAVRIAVDLHRRQGPTSEGDAGLADLPSPELDPELRLLRDRYQAQFQRAFEGAAHALSSRDRNLLRYQLVDGLNVDQIALIYRVHRATAARWAAAARQTLAEDTRERLRAELRLPPEDLEGIIRWIQSQLDLSVRRLLGDHPVE